MDKHPQQKCQGFVGIDLHEDDLEPKADSQALHLAGISLLVARLFLPGQEPGHTTGALPQFSGFS